MIVLDWSVLKQLINFCSHCVLKSGNVFCAVAYAIAWAHIGRNIPLLLSPPRPRSFVAAVRGKKKSVKESKNISATGRTAFKTMLNKYKPQKSVLRYYLFSVCYF